MNCKISNAYGIVVVLGKKKKKKKGRLHILQMIDRCRFLFTFGASANSACHDDEKKMEKIENMKDMKAATKKKEKE